MLNFRQFVDGQEELVDKVINFFTSKANDPELFNRIQEFRKKDAIVSRYVPNLELLIPLGYLTIWDFMSYETDYATKKGFSLLTVELIVERMRDQGILMSQPLLQQRCYAVNETLAQFLAARGCLTNVVFGFQFIAEKYQHSIFKLVVEDALGNHHIGTGFLLSLPTNQEDVSVVVTNAHVVANAKALRVLRKTNEEVQQRKIIKSQVSDLAAVELADFQDLPPFCLAADPKVLDEVLTIGYPNVAMARDSYQLTHRGEINSIIQDRHSRALILFSAKTSPGNSGGPLINEIGLVTGIVCEDLFYKDALIEKGQLPYHAAIPSSTITKFFAEEYLAHNSGA